MYAIVHMHMCVLIEAIIWKPQQCSRTSGKFFALTKLYIFFLSANFLVLMYFLRRLMYANKFFNVLDNEDQTN